MGFLPTIKTFCLLFLVVSATLVSTSSAGRSSKFIYTKRLDEELLGVNEGTSLNEDDDTNEVSIHERLLRVNTHDYGRYDPAPSLPRPRHKLIPN